MAGLSYHEIFYTSSEKGIFSGNAGFGVRTCTAGMSVYDVDKIIDQCSTGYAVYNDRILDKEKILSNPAIVYEYPPAYIFRTVELNDGAIKYVFGRTVYIGIDYGFFKGINAYDRTGTNYITHLLVFDASVILQIDMLFSRLRYAPYDYHCLPTNVELQGLLTGTPEFLPENTFDVDPEEFESVDPDIALFVVGVVQMLRNHFRPSTDNAFRKMYVKCPARLVEHCLAALDVLPKECYDKVRYITNYMQGYGIPEGYDIAFVNEYNETELYEDNYITVDFFNGTKKNIHDNFILGKISSFISCGEGKTAAQLIGVYLRLEDVPDSEYESYYNVFVGAVSDFDIQLKDLTDSMIQILRKLHLDQMQSTMLWTKINRTLNEGLTTTHGKNFLRTIDIIKEIRKYFQDRIIIREDAVNYVTSILFNGRGNFGKIADEDNITTLLQLVNKDMVSSEELFLSSVAECHSKRIWEECLNFYYDGRFEGTLKVMSSIVHSSLSETVVNDLLLTIYPLADYADTLFDFFKQNPVDVVRARNTVESLIKYYGESHFSDFVWLSHVEPELVKILYPILTNYYCDRIESNTLVGTDSLFDFLGKVGCDQIDGLNLWPVLEMAAEKHLAESVKDIEIFLSRLHEMRIHFPESLESEVTLLSKLVKREVPNDVGCSFMGAVFNNYPNDVQYQERVFSVWLEKGIGKSEMKSFMSRNQDKINDAAIESFVKVIWNHPSLNMKNERESLVLSVLDNSGWGSKKMERFASRSGDQNLEKFLRKSSSVLARMIRKLSDKITGNKYLMAILVCFIGCMSGHARPIKWHNPYNYVNYECLSDSRIKSIKSSTYDHKGKISRIYVQEFGLDGNLIKEFSLNGTDTSDVVRYDYRRGKLVGIVSEDDITRKLKYSRDGYLEEVRYFGDRDGKRTLIRITSTSYNQEGRVTTYYDDIVTPADLSEGKPAEIEISQVIQFTYQEGKLVSYVIMGNDSDYGETTKREYVCNDMGIAKEMTISDPESGKVRQVIKFSYKKDNEENWVERTDRSKGRLIRTVKRELSYYSDEELASLIPGMSKDNIGKEGVGTVGDYLVGIKNRVEFLVWKYEGEVWLIVIVLFLTLAGMVWTFMRMIRKPFFKRHIMDNGMKRLWMYDSSRYLNVLSYFGMALVCFIGALLAIALVGGLAWLMAWVIKLLFVVIIWIGIILIIVGILGALGRSEIAGALIPGILIVMLQDTLEEWGESIVDWSFDFLKRVNMIGLGFNIIVDLWDVILLVFVMPVLLFLSVALAIIVINTLLNGIEWIVVRVYSIRRPCPCCGSTQTPDYMINGKVHPVRLHPGTFGVFYQLSPEIGKRIPTMLLNGKGKLDRRCPHCGAIIHADAEKSYGTDVHIGFVGHRSSGKSYLLYSGLDTLVRTYPTVRQIDADMGTKIGDKKRRIDARQGIQTDVANKYRAVQLMVTTKLRPVPYHLFFYDVAGEKFNASSSSYKTAMEFYKNVQSIVFIIDPSMIDYTGIPASERIKSWAARPEINQGETYRIESSFSVLKDILESVGQKPKRIDFSFVCTKSDMGYFEAEGLARKDMDEQSIECFVGSSLGLSNLVNSAKASFNSVHFFEISVMEDNSLKLRQLFGTILEQRGVRF